MTPLYTVKEKACLRKSASKYWRRTHVRLWEHLAYGMEYLLKGRIQYSWPPCTKKANIVYFLLNKQP